jgi:hypothetical protein
MDINEARQAQAVLTNCTDEAATDLTTALKMLGRGKAMELLEFMQQRHTELLPKQDAYSCKEWLSFRFAVYGIQVILSSMLDRVIMGGEDELSST